MHKCNLNIYLRLLPTTTTEIKHKIGAVLEDGGNYMRKDELDTLLSLISKLKPNEWTQIVLYVQKKYSSKQASVPMPSMEELSDYSANLDFPGLMKSQSEGEI